MAKRNYKREYATYHSQPSQIARRSSRNSARRKMVKAGAKVAGKDVAHRNGNPRDNRRKNLTVQSKSKNRSFARNSNSSKRNPRA